MISSYLIWYYTVKKKKLKCKITQMFSFIEGKMLTLPNETA